MAWYPSQLIHYYMHGLLSSRVSSSILVLQTKGYFYVSKQANNHEHLAYRDTALEGIPADLCRIFQYLDHFAT